MTSAGNEKLDGRTVAKLVALLDSPEETEAVAALYRIRALLKGQKFFEAVESHEYKTYLWEKQGRPECLRKYFEAGTGGQRHNAALKEELVGVQLKLRQTAQQLLEVQSELLAQQRQGTRLHAENEALQAELERQAGIALKQRSSFAREWQSWQILATISAIILVIIATVS